MEFEFDKEIDALLRQTAKSETAPANNNLRSAIRNSQFVHLDADGISAFAENALPEKTKQKYTAHFAGCDRCRTILSNTIALNAEAVNATASLIVEPKAVKTSKNSFYKRFFEFPNLAYSLGTLVVLLGGFLIFSILQNGTGSQNTEVSQISESQPKANGPSYTDESESQNLPTQSNENAASTNSMMGTVISNTSTAINSSNASTAVNDASGQKTSVNSSMFNTSAVKKETANEAENKAENKTEKETAPDLAKTENLRTMDAATAGGAAATESVSEKQTVEAPKNDKNLQTIRAAPAAPPAADSSAREKRTDARLRSADKRASVSTGNVPSKQIGGKNFERRENVWYDSDYKGQGTTNVSRGSDAYKKLDFDLRSTADNLGGTVVVVWKGKAYRIQ